MREEPKWTPKIDRDKAGKPQLRQMGSDWPEDWKSPKWDPNL